MQSYYEQYSWVTWIVVPGYLFTIVAGAFGNIVVLRAYSTQSKARIWNKPYNLILTHGVVADLIICLVFTPILLLYRSNASALLIEPSPLCETSAFTSILAVSLQYIVFPLLSLNRRDVHVSPHSPWLTKGKCKLLLVAAWLLCVFISAVLVVLIRVAVATDGTPKLYRCILVNTKWDPVSAFFLGYCALLYLVSCATAFVCYRQISEASRSNPDQPPTVDEMRRTKMCKIVAVVYSLFWMPFLFVQLYGLFINYSEVVFNCHALSSVPGVMASAVNPYLYSSMDHDYKKKFVNIAKSATNDD